MPSWNIHTGLAERLAARQSLADLGVRDFDHYHFGNLVPDLYVGYVVPDVSHTLRYIDTHYGQPAHIPVPRADQFWDDYIAPAIPLGGVDDVTLGAWAHLVADGHYNARVRAFIQDHGIPNGEQTRIRKQSDFDRFGHSLGIVATIEPTPQLKAVAARFPQYAVEPRDVEAACRAHAAQVRASQEKPAPGGYSLLPRELIQEVFDAILVDTAQGLAHYAALVRAGGHDPLAPAPASPVARPPLPVFAEPAVRFAQDYQAGAAANDHAPTIRPSHVSVR